MSLHKSSVLVKLTIAQWDGFKKDKRVSEHVDVEFKTAGGAGNYNKRLLDKSVLQPILKITNKIRQEHTRLTMPWCYDGVSLLPSKMYFQYTELMRELTDLFDQNVSNLITQYPIYKANQRSVLGSMWDPDDYPSQDSLRHRFSVSYRFFPVPQSEHFIVDLEAAEAAKMKTALQQELVDTQTAALQSLYDRAIKLVEHVHERLSDPQNIFRNTLVENVADFVKTLPLLNVFDDPKLEQVCHELKSKVLIADADDLRTDQLARQRVADGAYDVLALLKGEMASAAPAKELEAEFA